MLLGHFQALHALLLFAVSVCPTKRSLTHRHFLLQDFRLSKMRSMSITYPSLLFSSEFSTICTPEKYTVYQFEQNKNQGESCGSYWLAHMCRSACAGDRSHFLVSFPESYISCPISSIPKNAKNIKRSLLEPKVRYCSFM